MTGTSPRPPRGEQKRKKKKEKRKKTSLDWRDRQSFRFFRPKAGYGSSEQTCRLDSAGRARIRPRPRPRRRPACAPLPPLRTTVETGTTYLARCPPLLPLPTVFHRRMRGKGRPPDAELLRSLAQAAQLPSSGTWG
ncbi:hypothetical protein LX36DRAFT_148545 [Colletotrichum falcatum]|nr:hypothetical protein LX36DRAFT_148545 [Colletotrichum falcatum]